MSKWMSLRVRPLRRQTRGDVFRCRISRIFWLRAFHFAPLPCRQGKTTATTTAATAR
jgi:hypothetical protein